MDGKRRINPQNPPRKIRGRKQKKPRLLDVLATIPDPAPSLPQTRDAAVPEDTPALVAEPQDLPLVEGTMLDE
jgi:hypothetical protein